MLRIVLLSYLILGFVINASCQKYFMKTYDMNQNRDFGEVSRSSVLSRDGNYLFITALHEYLNNGYYNVVMNIEKYDIQNKTMTTIDSIFIPNKGVYGSLAWRGGLVAISDTSYVVAYQLQDTFNKSRPDYKIYTELYCFTDKGDSLWTYTYTGTDSLTYLGEVFFSNQQIYVTIGNYYKRNSLHTLGNILVLNKQGKLLKINFAAETLKNQINGFNDLYFKDSNLYCDYAYYPQNDTSNEGIIYRWDTSFSVLDSVKLISTTFNTRLLKIVSIEKNVITYFGMWDTAYPYDPKLKDALHYVYYIAKVDNNGKLLGRYFLEDGIKQNFFNAVHAVKKKNGDYLLLLNEDSKLPENDYGNVNIGLYCMSPSGVIKWKRKYFTHRRPKNDTYSSDLVLNANDDIFITGYANNLYDTTDLEWDILLIAADSNGCIPGMDCTNYYVPTVSNTEISQPIPWVVYPNPSSGRFTILLSSPASCNAMAQITDMSGKVVWQEKISEGTFDIPVVLTSTNAGIYSLQLIDDKRQITGSRKIWIE